MLQQVSPRLLVARSALETIMCHPKRREPGARTHLALALSAKKAAMPPLLRPTPGTGTLGCHSGSDRRRTATAADESSAVAAPVTAPTALSSAALARNPAARACLV